jgi:hypothetical protein
MTEVSFQMQGRFKFEVFNRDGSLSYSTEYTPNFITPTGLNYLNEFGLADCFRFISLGTGTGRNTVLGGGTTGLVSPVSGYQYFGGNPIGGRGNQYIEGACGFRVERTGLTLFRGWRIPESGRYFESNHTFQEFMVTPGPTRVWGYRYGGLSGACNCNQEVYVDSSEVGETRTGIESPDFHGAFPQICDADKAFARVLRRLPVLSGQFLIAHYSLFVTANTGINSFKFTGGRGTVYNGENNDGIFNWSGVSGRQSLVHWGLKPINDGSVTSAGGLAQIHPSYTFRMGESYIPYFGMPLEPSCPLEKRIGYLSSDNFQFLVNPFGGAISDTGQYFPFNTEGEPFPSGVIYFMPKLIKGYGDDNNLALEDNEYIFYQRLINARRNNALGFKPHTGDIRVTNTYTVDEVFSTEVSGSGVNLPNTGRNRSLALIYKYDDENLTGYKVSRAHVQAYKHSTNTTQFYPFVDMVFTPQDTHGNFTKDPILTADYTSGIKFHTINMVTGTGDFPPMSVDVTSPYPTHFPGTFHQRTVSGNSELWFWGLFYSDTFRNQFKTRLVQFSGGGGNGPIDTTLLGPGVGAPVNNPRMFCYATPLHNSGFVSGLSWLGTGFPQEAVELTTFNVVQGFPFNGGSGNVFWPRLDYFLATDVVYPQWLLTGQNCVFCTGRYNGGINGGSIYLTKCVVELSNGEWWMHLDSNFANYTSITFLPNHLTSYRFPSGALLTGAIGGYSYMDWNNQLATKFYLNWSSPCSTGVIGC